MLLEQKDRSINMLIVHVYYRYIVERLKVVLFDKKL